MEGVRTRASKIRGVRVLNSELASRYKLVGENSGETEDHTRPQVVG